MKNFRMQTATFAIGCGVLFGLTVIACGGSIFDGDEDDDDGDCVGGSGGGPVGTSAYTVAGVTTNAGTGVVSAVATTVGTTSGGGMCPDDPGFQGCGSGSGTTAAGGTVVCTVWYCDPDDSSMMFERQCSTETGTCTCTGAEGTCTCDWNGDCQTPCCGEPPDGF
jgi:hypothetical protein